jgi:hypothetical protein
MALLIILIFYSCRAYGKKHGPRAWLEHRKLLDERRADAEAVAEYRRIEADLDAAYGPNREK